MSKIGDSIVRREDQRFLTGKGRYTDDTVPPETLAVLFVRSPHAHARIAGIDKKAASASPGVVAVYTAEDSAADKLGHLPAISEIKDEAGNRHREPAHLPMAVGKVRHVGDIVAMVVADTLDRARDAAETLVVDYEPLPAVVTVAQALAPGAPMQRPPRPPSRARPTCRASRSVRRARSCTMSSRARPGRPTIRPTTWSP